ncbi:MAG: hypothetical protein AAB692_02010, partial [Patescibacteria group bacterium]
MTSFMTEKRRHWTATVAVGAVFFFAYSFLPLAAPPTFNSPDERANHHFAELFAETGRLWFFEPLNLAADDRIHPRSMRVVDHFTVPGGFLGLPVLYGGAVKAFGTRVLPYITPLLAVLAVLAWGALVGRWFGEKIGLVAGGLLLAHPVWWYQSARTLMPNVPFVSMLVIGAAFFWIRPMASTLARRQHRSVLTPYLDDLMAGIFAGLALFVRPSEISWMLVAALAAALMLRRDLPWRRLAIAGVAAGLAFAPTFILNNAVYGHPFSSGYGAAFAGAPMNQLPAGRASALFGSLTPYLFPLGFAPRTALRNFLTYGLAFFPWWSFLVGAALASFGVKTRRGAKISKNVSAFGAAAAAASIWLIFFYGSWIFSDNPDPDAVTIGSSYLRYWLPIFVLSTVPVAWLF